MTTTVESPASRTTDSPEQLASGSLSMWQVLLFGLAALGLPTLITVEASYVMGAGNAGWLSVLVLVAIIVPLAAVVVHFARKYVVAGSLMSYFGKEVGPKAGFVGSSTLFVGYVGVICLFLCIFPTFFFGALAGFGLPAPGIWWQLLFSFAVLLLLLLLQRRGVGVSVNVAIILGLGILPVPLFIFIAAIVRNGIDLTPQLTLDGISGPSFIAGVVIAFGAFVGFEGLTALAKETRDPRKTMPKVVISLVVIIGAAAVIATLFAMPLMLENGEALAEGISPVSIMATAANMEGLGAIANLLLAIQTLGALLAYLNDSSRVVSTAGSEGYLPSFLSKIHPTYHTPATAAQFMVALSIGLVTLYTLFIPGGLYGAVTSFLQFFSYAWIVAYIALAIVGAVAFVRSGRKVVAYAMCVPLAVIMSGIFVYSFATATGEALVAAWLAVVTIVIMFFVSWGFYRSSKPAARAGNKS